MSSPVEDCPCGSGATYAAGGLRRRPVVERALTAEALMRSRYTAYARSLTGYVFRTWRPCTPPADPTAWQGTAWTGLEVLRTVDGGPGS